jgi:hypothetical protein
MVVNSMMNGGEYAGEYVGEYGGDNLVKPMVNFRSFHTCFSISGPKMAAFWKNI